MDDDMLARCRYDVRDGNLRFGELVLDAMSAIATCEGFLVDGVMATHRVIEVIDHQTGTVVRRCCRSLADAEVEFDAIALDLNRLDVASFARVWNVKIASATAWLPYAPGRE
jgi:hypothetical protein